MGDSLEPFKFFQNEISHDEIIVRANAMKHVVHVVSLMDAAAVRDEMLPFLQSKRVPRLSGIIKRFCVFHYLLHVEHKCDV
jgi:hypothetical protein